jgi:hypothetical protein
VATIQMSVHSAPELWEQLVGAPKERVANFYVKRIQVGETEITVFEPHARWNRPKYVGPDYSGDRGVPPIHPSLRRVK